MKLNIFLFRIPGSDDHLFDLEEISRLPKSSIVEVIDNRVNNRTRHGTMNVSTAIQKFR